MFDWNEYLPLARELTSPERGEAALRTAINRAYFCAYHRATLACQDKTPVAPRKHRVWKQIEEYGLNNNLPHLEEIETRGAQLHWLRIRVDYDNPHNITSRRIKPLPQLAIDAIVQAEELLALIDRL